MQLLGALRKYGSGDVKSISEELMMRSPQDIADMIKRYERIAHRQDNELFQEKAPIDQWAQIVFKNSQHNTLCPIARAFKYIEEFEFQDNTKSGINVRDLYKMLAQLSEGIVPKSLDTKTSQFLKNLLKELAREVYDEDTRQAVEYLDNLSPKTFPKKSVDSNDPHVRCEIILNPLSIPEDIYKNSS